MQRLSHATFPQKLIPSEEILSIHDGSPQNYQEEPVPQEISTDPTALQEEVLEKITLEESLETPDQDTIESNTPEPSLPEPSLAEPAIPTQTTSEVTTPEQTTTGLTTPESITSESYTTETPGTTIQEDDTPKLEITESKEQKECLSQEVSRAHDKQIFRAIQDQALQRKLLSLAAEFETEKDVIPKVIVPCEALRDQALQSPQLPRAEFQAENEVTPKPNFTPLVPIPIGYSPFVWPEIAPEIKTAGNGVVVFVRKRRQANEFARSIMEDGRAYWTDASHIHLDLPEGAQSHHGGIAVTRRLNQIQWQINSAHVAGLSGVSDLERLAILVALQTAVRDREAELRGAQTGTGDRPVFKICSDNQPTLQ